MNTEQTEDRSVTINHEQLLTLVSALLHGNRGREDDQNPLPPGPWDPIIRSALERIRLLGGGHGFGDEVMLNPQPLPPRFAFLTSVARAVVSRAELLQELAGAIAREGEEQGIIIVSGYTRRFSEDWCGNEFRPKWPFPGPPPPWFASELDGIDLVVMATQFNQAAKETFSPDLRQNLADVSAKFVETGLSKMQ
jgi:hypothetical protein